MRRLFPLAVAVALVFIAAIIAHTVREKPHGFDETECMRCHVDHEGDPKKLMAPVSKLCGRCHKRGLSAASHPVDIAPSLARVPIDMPLTDGKITCSTCHNLHAKRYNAFGEKSNFLRRPGGGRDFCTSCHELNPLDIGHRGTFDTAHIGRKYKVADEHMDIDPMSVECIGCHDGVTGPSADYAVGSGVWEHEGGAHPIGVSYSDSRMEGKKLKPMSQLSKKIRFYGGKIGCGTCHDPYSKRPAHLVMDNARSRLCTECHFDK